jgi:septum formation protein
VSFWYPCDVPLVLASRSPRRHSILLAAGIPHTVHYPDVEEDNTSGPPESVVESHAKMKASSVADLFPERPVLGADTLVCVGGEVLGKPRTDEEAVAMLNRLSGRWHEVWGGVCLIWRERGTGFSFAERTLVEFRRLSADEIRAYADSGEPMDKAGAYGIQELGSLLVQRVEGCFFNVMGLPVARLMEEFRSALRDTRGSTPAAP